MWALLVAVATGIPVDFGPVFRGSPFAGPSSGTRRREHASSDSTARRPGPRIELPGSSARAPRDLCTPEGRASLRAREAPPRASIDRRWPDVFVAKSPPSPRTFVSVRALSSLGFGIQESAPHPIRILSAGCNAYSSTRIIPRVSSSSSFMPSSWCFDFIL